jgi:hypothetical protein
MKSTFRIACALFAALMTGCAAVPQTPIPFTPQTLDTTKATKIGVAMATLPVVDTFLPGAGCLLCLAAASIANSSLTTHTQTLPYEDLPQLKTEVAELLRKKGAEVVVIPEDLVLKDYPSAANKGPNLGDKDFSALKTKYQIDRLLVIHITGLRMERTYANYIPTSEPKAFLYGQGYIVNLGTNAYEWYLPVQEKKSADGKWDEPPKFPGLTNAYFQVIELGKDRFTKPFSE